MKYPAISLSLFVLKALDRAIYDHQNDSPILVKVERGIDQLGTVVLENMRAVRLPYNTLPPLLLNEVHNAHLLVCFQFLLEVLREGSVGFFFCCGWMVRLVLWYNSSKKV